MQNSKLRIAASLSLVLVAQISVGARLLQPAAAQSWAEQQARNQARQAAALAQQARDGYSPNGLSRDGLQAQRWQQEFAATHPGQPMPNPGILQKMHMGEIRAQTNQAWNDGRAIRQAKLQHDYQMSRQFQEQKLAAQHITWSPAQWAQWDRGYDAKQKSLADGYLEGIRMQREVDSEEMRRRALGF